MPEVRLELLIGKLVRDASGQPAGRLQEVRVRRSGDGWAVDEYLLGGAALLERLSALGIGMAFLRLLGAQKSAAGYRVPWHQLDLSDPARPKLRCACHELEPLTPEQAN